MRSQRADHASPSQLNRDAVVTLALGIADAEGLAAVTIRRLAQDLGVTPMALYWHVSGKEELLAAMGDRVFVGLPPDTDPAAPWHDQLRELVVALTAGLRAHPSVAALAGPRVLQNDEGRRLTERALELLVIAGFPIEQAAKIARHALRTAVSLVMELATTGSSLDPVQNAEDVRFIRLALQGLPAERFPLLIEAADAFADCADEDAYYSFGIDLLIAGIESNVPARVGHGDTNR
ncbi:MAG: TetR family transcriptional regulator [Acidimicrobiaceae bacterium]|nr:TetR family transcriptional regulator [Acidimicrobiaceae bacterium]